MDYRLLDIKSLGREIDDNRNKLKKITVSTENKQKIMQDLDAISNVLERYGNSIRRSIIVDGEEKILVIEFYEDSYKKYRLENKHKTKNKDNEEVNISSVIDPNFSYNDSQIFIAQIALKKQNNDTYENYIPLPLTESEWSFLLENWEEIYNDLLDYICRKLTKEKEKQEIIINRIKKFS